MPQSPPRFARGELLSADKLNALGKSVSAMRVIGGPGIEVTQTEGGAMIALSRDAQVGDVRVVITDVLVAGVPQGAQVEAPVDDVTYEFVIPGQPLVYTDAPYYGRLVSGPLAVVRTAAPGDSGWLLRERDSAGVRRARLKILSEQLLVAECETEANASAPTLDDLVTRLTGDERLLAAVASRLQGNA